MASKDSALQDPPIEALRKWLLREWEGPFDFIDVQIERRETADGREDAWYIFPVVEDGPDAEWDPKELSDVDIAVRDKALELGLEYPWFVFVRSSDEDEPMEDDTS